MALFSLATLTTNVTTASADLEIIANTAAGYKLLEIGFSSNAGTACQVGLGKPAANGGTPTTPVAVTAEDIEDTTAGQTTTALAWGTGPTVPGTFFRNGALPATQGSGLIWTFPRGLTVSKGTSNTIVLWNQTATPGFNVWIVVDE